MAQHFTPTCMYYLRGICRYGSRCRFFHPSTPNTNRRHNALPFHHRKIQFNIEDDHSDGSNTTNTTNKNTNNSRIRVMSYNILADEYAHGHSRELYSSVPQQALEWQSRISMIAREVAHWSPDIVCFQEVDHYNDLERLLRPHGYDGLYLQRTNDRLDGLATFWKSHKFVLHTEHQVQYAALGLRDNVAQITLLKEIVHNNGNEEEEEDISTAISIGGGGESGGNDTTSDNDDSNASAHNTTNDIMIIANIHVLFNPKRGDIKIAQVRIMLEEAYRMSKQLSQHNNLPIIVCGDFNSAAGSPLYRFITDNSLDLSTTDRRRLSGQVEVAGRTGWPSLQNTFLSAISDGYNERDALYLAIGELPKYNSMMDPYNSMRDPQHSMVMTRNDQMMMMESIDVMGMNVSMVQQSNNNSSNSSNNNNNSGTNSGRAQRKWSKDDLEVAVGICTYEYSQIEEEEDDGGVMIDNTDDNNTTVKHPLKLQSAYHSVTGSEPLYTTVHDKYVGTVDYIFYTPSSLKSVNVLLPPPLSTLRHGLPSMTWPSDHICLVTEFERT